jgi:hypothetical protein
MRLGTDPEVFLQDAYGKPVSAIGYIGADKWSPLQVRGLRKGFTLQEDNVALEFGVPPASSADEFVKNIRTVMKAGLKRCEGLSFSRLSCTIFPKDQMQHPNAFVFGCEPDYNAWTGKENPKPQPPHQFMRSAGGHIHIETKQDPSSVGRRMDLFAAVPSTLMDEGEKRKQLYGKMGAIRVKPYGVEYRTLSNFWIFDDELIRWAWRATERALNSDLPVENLEEAIREAVDYGNKNVARELVKEFNLEVI